MKLEHIKPSNDEKQALLESSLSRIYSKLKDHTAGIITAFRGEYTHRENLQRNKQLRAKLVSAGMQVTAIQGKYIENYGTDEAKEVTETSFFVVNPKKGDDGGRLKELLMKLGEEYEQDTVLVIPYGGEAVLIGTSKKEGVSLGYHEEEKIGKPKFGDFGKFFSKIRGRPFVIESVREIERPANILGLYAAEVIAKKDWRDISI